MSYGAISQPGVALLSQHVRGVSFYLRHYLFYVLVVFKINLLKFVLSFFFIRESEFLLCLRHRW